MIREIWLDGVLVESIEEPDPPTEPDPVAVVPAADVVAALASINGSSTMAQVRSALIALRTAAQNI